MANPRQINANYRKTERLLEKNPTPIDVGVSKAVEDAIKEGGGSDYTAGSGISISEENVISNTAQPDVNKQYVDTELADKLNDDFSNADVGQATAGQVLAVNDSANGVEFVTPSGGLPTIASGDAGKVLTVNTGETGTEWVTPVSGGGITHIANMTLVSTEVILAGKVFTRELYLDNLDINKKYLFIFKPQWRAECIYRFNSGRINNRIYIKYEVINCGTSLTTMSIYLDIYEVEGLNSDICYAPGVSIDTFPMPNNFLLTSRWSDNKLYTFVQCNGQLNTVFVADSINDVNKIVTISSNGKGFSNINEIESDSSNPTTSTVGRLGEVFINTSTQDAFICTNVDSAIPEYTWKKITLT